MRDGASFDPRAQRGQIGGKRRATARRDNLDVAVKARNCRVNLGREPKDAPLDSHAVRPCRRRQQPLGETGPRLRQTVAHEQHDIGAHPRFAGRDEHDPGLAQAVEIPQDRRRMPVLDDPAYAFGERDRSPRPFDIRAQPRDERLTALRQQARRGGGRVVERSRPAVDRRCSLDAG